MGNYLPFIFGFRLTTSGSGDVISGDVISGDATSGDVISGDDLPHDPPQIISGWCLYTTSLSPIRRVFAPGFVNYKKECTRLAAANDNVYQLLGHGR